MAPALASTRGMSHRTHQGRWSRRNTSEPQKSSTSGPRQMRAASTPSGVTCMMSSTSKRRFSRHSVMIASLGSMRTPRGSRAARAR